MVNLENDAASAGWVRRTKQCAGSRRGKLWAWHWVCLCAGLRVLGLKGEAMPHSCVDVARGTKLCFDMHVEQG